MFTWTPKEMTGVDPKIICHHLNVDPQYKSMVQKKRRSAIQHTKAIIEVDRLLKADGIREVYNSELTL